MMKSVKKIVNWLGSLELTLVLLGLTVVMLLYSRASEEPVDWLIGLPLGGLAANLIAALFVNRRLRIQGGLLIFHLALAFLAGIAAVGQLIQMEGHVEVTVGTAFDANLVVAEKAPFHDWKLDRVKFIQQEFNINYAPGMNRRETVSNIVLIGNDGQQQKVKIGDDKPLVAQGYRFYTTFNKGYAPVLTFEAASGDRAVGAVHLPSYPRFDYKQMNNWRPPGSDHDIKLWLRPEREMYNKNSAWNFRKPSNPVLVVIEGDQRQEIKTGGSAKISSGRLHFSGLNTWMGYKIHYNPTTHWLFMAALIAVLGLLWHVIGKFLSTPWNIPNPGKHQEDQARVS